MKILIIGGSRFIGKAVAHLAASKNHDVILFNRGKTEPATPFRQISGNVDQINEHKATLRELNPDIVIHAIAYTKQHALDAIDIFGGLKTRVIVLSSQDCYEAFYQLNRGKDVAELPLAEDGQLCLNEHYWKDLAGTRTYPDYDKNLVTNEFMTAQWQGHLSATVLRLPMVFGPGDFQFRCRHGKFIRRIFDKQSILVMGAVEQTSLFTFGYIDNIAAAIMHAVETPSTAGKIFNLGELKTRSLRRWAEIYGDAANVSFSFQILPDALVENDLLAINNPPRLLLCDTQSFAKETGFEEAVPLREQVQRTLAWGLENPDALGPKPDYVAEQSKIETYQRWLSRTLIPFRI